MVAVMINRLRELLEDYTGRDATDDDVLQEAIWQIERLQGMDGEIEETGVELDDLIERYYAHAESPPWGQLGLELWRQGVVTLTDLNVGSEQAVFDVVSEVVR